jgi:hypothetical protein
MKEKDPNLPRVLICCPTSDRKAYCQDEYIFRAKKIAEYYNGVATIFMADNSATKDNYSRLILEYGIRANYIAPRGRTNLEFIAESHEACRIFAIANKFEWMLHLESDILPPLNVITRLMRHQKKVVNGMYHLGKGYDSFLLMQGMEELGDKRCTYNIDRGDLMEVTGDLVQNYHFGLGCALIHKSVFECINFQADGKQEFHSDSLFATRLFNKGIANFVDTSVLCEHLNIEWTTDY